MKSCFFIGHREASEEIFSALTEAVERHIVDYECKEKPYNTFLFLSE